MEKRKKCAEQFRKDLPDATIHQEIFKTPKAKEKLAEVLNGIEKSAYPKKKNYFFLVRYLVSKIIVSQAPQRPGNAAVLNRGRMVAQKNQLNQRTGRGILCLV